MPDTSTTVAHQGYFSRIGGAFVGVLFGFLFIAVALVLLFLNEGRAVRTAKTLAEGAAAVVDAKASAIDPSLDGKLVHVTGTTTSGTLSDPIFNVSADAAKLNRVVEVYQWKEDKQSQTRNDIVGGGTTTTTTYTYQHLWSLKLIDSFGFHDASHQNPTSKRVPDLNLTASNLSVGPYRLSDGLIAQIVPSENIPVDQVPAQAPRVTVAGDGVFYVGPSSGRAPDPASPQMGDLKISFLVARPQTVSVIALQSESTLAPYIATTGKSIEILKPGVRSHQQMFADAVSANRLLTWILRGAGFVVMTLGFLLVFGPLKVIAGVVGFVGDIVGMGVAMVSLILGASLSLITIALAWLVYRPFLGIALLALAGIFLFWLTALHRKRGLGPITPVAR